MKKRTEIARNREPEVKSYFGVNEFNQTDEGVIFECVSAPGGPADKAGLVGGDVILSVDGQPIHDDEQMADLMSRTPVGKTLDIEYMRDGEKKTTKLTTISLDEHRRLVREFERRPEGRGQFGYEDSDAETIQIPGTKIHGVMLGSILNSRPADLAGIKDADVVIEFDGVPIRHEQEFLMRVRRALPYSTVKVVLMRPKGAPVEGQTPEYEKLEIPVKMGKQSRSSAANYLCRDNPAISLPSRASCLRVLLQSRLARKPRTARIESATAAAVPMLHDCCARDVKTTAHQNSPL
jgi:S1-C subfamily serine protease